MSGVRNGGNKASGLEDAAVKVTARSTLWGSDAFSSAGKVWPGRTVEGVAVGGARWLASVPLAFQPPAPFRQYLVPLP